MGIDIWPWISDLSEGVENTWDILESLSGKSDKWGIWDVSGCDLSEMEVSWIGGSENSVTEAWDDLTTGKLIVAELAEVLIRWLVSECLLDLDEPGESLLSCESMEWTSKAIETCGIGEIWVRKSRADQMGSVSGHVTSLMVGVDSEVASDALSECF